MFDTPDAGGQNTSRRCPCEQMLEHAAVHNSSPELHARQPKSVAFTSNGQSSEDLSDGDTDIRVTFYKITVIL